MQSNLDHGVNPFSTIDAQDWEVFGTGMLAHYRFSGGGDDYARKALGDPDMVSVSYVHEFSPPGNIVSPLTKTDSQGDAWNVAYIDVNNDLIRLNHYAFLSQEDARKKAEANRNPFMTFNPQIDEFFSKERDTDIQYLLPALKQRLLSSIEHHPPAHPDDWSPPDPESP
jgi:hypothetical protein